VNGSGRRRKQGKIKKGKEGRKEKGYHKGKKTRRKKGG
jgi:hypothetical protein